jgi:hypothetical protein
MRSQRKPVSCYDTSDLDALTTADRAAPQGREGAERDADRDRAGSLFARLAAATRLARSQ